MLMNQIPNSFVLAEWFTNIFPCKAYMIHPICLIFEALVHSAIAVNRFSCFCSSRKLDFLWTNRGVTLLLLLFVALSAAFPAYSYLSSCVYIVANGRLLGATSADWEMSLVSCK